MEALWLPFLTVALAEIGDKTQLLAILLAARYRRPLTISAGILAATLANHALAASAGALAAHWLEGDWFRWAVALAFFAMAAWALVPDKADQPSALGGGSVFVMTTIAFFLAEMGDKTQIATALMGARYESPALVTISSTLGMMAANVPAVFLAERALRLIPMRLARIAAAALLALAGLLFLLMT